jgi:DNA-directed DNA polymerase III PolC
LIEPEAPGFVELLAKSCFSFLQGASHPQELVKRARNLGYRGLAVCDANGLYGVVRGYQEVFRPSHFETDHLRESNQQPFAYHIGVELTPHDGSPIVLLPMNKTGYSKITRLLTTAKRRAEKSFISVSVQEITAIADDIIAFPLPPWKIDQLRCLQDAFDDRIYLPVCKDYSWQAVHQYQQSLEIERELGIPVFATQRPLMHVTERRQLHDVLTCIQHGTTLQESATRLLSNGERYLKPLRELAGIWKERPDALARTLEISERLKFCLSELKYRYPQEFLPDGKTAPEYLRELALKGMTKFYPPDTPPEKLKRAHATLEKELEIIRKMEYEDYFLTLYEICQFAESRDIMFQGRGSAANSIVCYTLGLTAIDPIKYDLIFGRFISENRSEPPDIDIDFEHERREEVIQHIYEKYGSERAAMVCTVIRYRSRLAVREVAKVFGVPLNQINALVRFMGREGLKRILEEKDGEAKFNISADIYAKIQDLAEQLQGFPRHLSIHSGGFVMTQDHLVDIVPVEKATMTGRYVIQWNKDDIEVLKMMKVDVLSLGMLTALKKMQKLVLNHDKINLDLRFLPPKCAVTYEMIQKADTIGVFQIESRAQMSLLPRLKPEKFYDLVIEVAIVRPGPLQGGMVHPFIRRKRGLDTTYVIPEPLKPILAKTFGVPIFQEQIMRIATEVAGFTEGESDELRRIMSASWTKPGTMESLKFRVMTGMMNKGISRDYAESIYKTMQGFASYGFPESHAASFALLTYASCYFKKHHPDAFVVGLLNSQPMGFYSPRSLIADAQRHGVIFRSLDVNHSYWDYVFEAKVAPHAGVLPRQLTQNRRDIDQSLTTDLVYQPFPEVYPQQSGTTHPVRVGFTSVYGLAQKAVEHLLAERARGGIFRDLADFVQRTNLPRSVLIRLGTAGALECFGLPARDALWTLQGLNLDAQSLGYGHSLQLNAEAEATDRNLIRQESLWGRVQREYLSKGFSVELHPLSVLRPTLKRETGRYWRAVDLASCANRSRVRVAGLLSLLQKPPTAKGFCFLTLEDETGLFNIVVEPKLYEKVRFILFENPLLKIEGILEAHQGVLNIKARSIESLTPALSESRAQLGSFLA